MYQLELSVDSSNVQVLLSGLDTSLSPFALVAMMQDQVSPYLRQRAFDRFATEGDAATGSWLPLSEVTNAIRESQGYPPDHPINHRTGELESYITNASANVVLFESGVELIFPGETPPRRIASKIKTAQSGSSNPRTPARPVLALDESDYAFIMGAISGLLNFAVSRSGRTYYAKRGPGGRFTSR